METKRTYIAIDLKSFYASVECVERGLNPLKTHLVVADESRTEKTICLAVSPSLKAYGIPGRTRLFDVNAKVKTVNAERLRNNYGRTFTGISCNEDELAKDPSLELGFHIAVPRMSFYMDYSTRIYKIYLKYIAPEDIHVYSIDEVFMDVTSYLHTYGVSAHELAVRMIRDVLRSTGITATAGIGPNLYLAKVAMDIVAKHIPADADGVRIAELDEISYREQLWTHRPLTDFWRVGRGTARRLEDNGLYTMGDVARCSLGRTEDKYNEDFLYKLFGVNAELLIDHAWGAEYCTMADIKAYEPSSESIGSGQVLFEPYPFEKARIVVTEMADQLSFQLVDKGKISSAFVLHIGYDAGALNDEDISYTGAVEDSWYGKRQPKSAHGTAVLKRPVSSASMIRKAVQELYDRIVDPYLPVRRIYLTAVNLQNEADYVSTPVYEQMDLFAEKEAEHEADTRLDEELAREKKAQEAILKIRRKYGNNAVLKGTNLQKGATGRERNKQIGGHKA